jgi:hypothetical protein
MTTLLFSILKNKIEIGKIFVTDCPDVKLAEGLLEFGDDGYKFCEIIDGIYDFDDVELLTTSTTSGIPHYDNKTCIIPWNLAYKPT